MNARTEMKKALKAFGHPLTLISNGKKIRALGLFQKIQTKAKNVYYDCDPDDYYISVFSNENSICDVEKFSLWAYDFKHIKSVDKIIYKNETFEVLTGFYDSQIGCWRLIIIKKIKKPNI